MTYADLGLLLENANADTTEKFIKTLPASALSHLDNNFSGIKAAYENGSLGTFSSYSSGSFTDNLVTFFAEAGLMTNYQNNGSFDIDTAKTKTFGDVTEADVKAFISNLVDTNPALFIYTFMTDENNNDSFDSTDSMHAIANKIIPEITDKAAELISNGVTVFNTNNSNLTADTTTLTHGDMQDILDFYIARVANSDSNLYTDSSLENELLFEFFIQKELINTFEGVLDLHMSKLGDYLFAPDATLTNIDSVDTWAELGAHS